MPLADIRARLVRELREARSELDRVLSAAVEISEQPGDDPIGTEDMLVAGQPRLIGSPDLADRTGGGSCSSLFAQARDLGLLERCTAPRGGGSSSARKAGCPARGLRGGDCPLRAPGPRARVLGVIGPTRMAYERVIPMSRATATCSARP